MDKFQQFFKSSFKNNNDNYDNYENGQNVYQERFVQNQEKRNNEFQDRNLYSQGSFQNMRNKTNSDDQQFSNSSKDESGFQCQKHPKNKITNFCLNKECQVPLCPECIKSHTQRHVKNGEQINYETIDQIVESVSSQLQISEELLQESSHQIKGLQRLSQCQIDEIDDYLENARQNLYNKIDNFIDGFKQEIKSIVQQKQQQSDSQIQQFTQLNQKLQQVQLKYQTSLEQNDDRLKTIMQVLKDNYTRICQDYAQDLQNFKMQLQKDKVNIQIDENQAANLQKELLRYLKVTNLHKKRDFSKFDPFSQDNLVESIIINNQNNQVYKNPVQNQQNQQQPIVQYQYAQIYNQNIQQPQIIVQGQQQNQYQQYSQPQYQQNQQMNQQQNQQQNQYQGQQNKYNYNQDRFQNY